MVGEADLVADGGAHLGAQFLGDPLGHGASRDPAGLGVADLAGHAPAELQADLGQLGRLARAGLARDDDHLVVGDDGRDLVFQLADRQLRRIGDDRDRTAAGLDAGGGGVEFPGEAAERLVAGRDVGQAGHLVDAAIQPPLVAQHQAGQGGSQLSER